MFKFNLKLVLSLAGILGFGLVSAQHTHEIKCATDEIYHEYYSKNPAAKSILENAKMQMAELKKNPQTKAGAVVKIPVVVHVIHMYGEENISKAQIDDQIRILNEDFRRLNADAANTRQVFQGVAADFEVEFVLAKKDPQGNCTDGIVRVYSPLTEDARDNVKAVSYWPSDRYLNVWVVKSIRNFSNDNTGITLGYAQFPWDRASRPTTDGIVVRADYFGSIGTAGNNNSAGRTTTHEVGHWLGLFHTFQGGCFGSGGFVEDVDDTPPAAGPNYGCNPNINSCSNDNPNLPDQIENYMDYSNGSCQNMFTQGQKEVSQFVFQLYRPLIITQANAVFTGVDNVNNNPLCAPKADMNFAPYFVCAGDQITLSDVSWGGAISNYTWTLPGATPSTSNQANPSVTYHAPGIYDVTLTASNASGSSNITRVGKVIVRNPNGDFGAPYSEGFELSAGLPNGFATETNDTSWRWKVVNSAARTGNRSILILINENEEANKFSSLILPNIVLNSVGAPVLKFWNAHARRGGTSTDRLRIYGSTDCGKTWFLITQRAGVSLSSAPDFNGADFIPTQDQWREQTVLLANWQSAPSFSLKFEAQSDAGNNIYIDDINITSANSVENLELGSEIKIFPNPFNSSTQVAFNLINEAKVAISVTDITGKEIYTRAESLYSSGDQSFELSSENGFVSNGIYLVNISINGKVYTRKLVLNR